MEILIAQADTCAKRGWEGYTFACLPAPIDLEPIKSAIQLLRPRAHVHKESRAAVNVYLDKFASGVSVDGSGRRGEIPLWR